MAKKFYETLGISESATADEIKSAYLANADMLWGLNG